MAKHNLQAALKAARNDAYAERFPARGRGERKKQRAARVAAREQAWCVAHSIDPSPAGGLNDVLRGKRRRAR